jgi:hypothetical protein
LPATHQEGRPADHLLQELLQLLGPGVDGQEQLVALLLLLLLALVGAARRGGVRPALACAQGRAGGERGQQGAAHARGPAVRRPASSPWPSRSML